MSLNTPFVAERIAQAMQHLGSFPDQLPPLVLDAGILLAEQLIQGHKILVAGNDSLGPLAQLFCNNMTYSDPDLRPALPALLISPATGVFLASAADKSNQHLPEDSNHIINGLDWNHHPIVRQLEAMGQSGDALLLLCHSSTSVINQKIMATARARNISTVVIGQMDTSTKLTANQQTLSLPLQCENLARMHEVCLFILNCLNDIIDDQLFGNS